VWIKPHSARIYFCRLQSWRCRWGRASEGEPAGDEPRARQQRPGQSLCVVRVAASAPVLASHTPTRSKQFGSDSCLPSPILANLSERIMEVRTLLPPDVQEFYWPLASNSFDTMATICPSTQAGLRFYDTIRNAPVARSTAPVLARSWRIQHLSMPG
jgi:hypothetical protein